MISGCLRAFDIIVNTPAEIRITARSRTMFISSDIARSFLNVSFAVITAC